MQNAIRDEAHRLRDVTRLTSWSLDPFKAHFTHCKFAVPDGHGLMTPVDFSTRQPQSAVDFTRYLFHILGIRDNICTFQRSTTLFDRRPGFTASTTLADLLQVWQHGAQDITTYTPATAHTMTDPDEKQALATAPFGTLYRINATGDRMRISAPETTAILLCQLTGADLYQKSVCLIRDIIPNIEVIQYDPSYTGTLFAKMHSTVINTTLTQVLFFEVSRNIGHLKVATPVDFGQRNGNSWRLHLQQRSFQLSAVICHRGTATSGHYTSFVLVPLENETDATLLELDQWCFYDDLTGHGTVIDPDAMDVHHFNPAQHGELFIYNIVPLVYTPAL